VYQVGDFLTHPILLGPDSRIPSPSELGASGLSTSSPVAWESNGASTSRVLLGIWGSTSEITGSFIEVEETSLPSFGEDLSLPTFGEEFGLSSSQLGRIPSLELAPGELLLLRISWHSAVNLARASQSANYSSFSSGETPLSKGTWILQLGVLHSRVSKTCSNLSLLLCTKEKVSSKTTWNWGVMEWVYGLRISPIRVERLGLKPMNAPLLLLSTHLGILTPGFWSLGSKT
jgi:hypothetical protein